MARKGETRVISGECVCGNGPKAEKGHKQKSLFEEGIWSEAAELFLVDCRIKGLFSKSSL